MRKGFTLIELLVVIAIIAILAAILFPVFARARARAQQNNCLSNVKQLQLGLIMYASDNDNRYPLDSVGSPAMFWQSTLIPYVKNTQIYVCPSDAAPFALAAPNTVPNSSYGINSYVYGMTEAYVQYPAELLGIIDALQRYVSYNTTLAGVRGQIATGGVATNARHNEGCNMSYLDGHAKWISFNNIPDPASGAPPAGSAAKHFWQGSD